MRAPYVLIATFFLGISLLRQTTSKDDVKMFCTRFMYNFPVGMRPTVTPGLSYFFLQPCLLLLVHKKKVSMHQPPLKTYKLAMAQVMVEAGKLDANINRA